MWPYWVMLLVPAYAAIASSRRPSNVRTSQARANQATAAWIFAGFVFTVLIGFRFEVGGDWVSYVGILFDTSQLSFQDVLARPDPGYAVLNWICAQIGWSVVAVNVFCGAVFSTALVIFCRRMPRPWLAVAVAVPYLVIVVSMGYSRQGVALAFAMIGLVYLDRRSILGFAVCIMAAATFHRTAILLLPIAAVAATEKKIWTATWIAVASAVGYMLFLQDSADDLYKNYIEAEYASEGALVRILMNALPAAIFILLRRRFELGSEAKRLWTWFSLISLALLVVLFLTPASTAVDRIGLYMLPLQLVVFSYVPDVLGHRGGRNQVWVAAVVFYYFAVQFVWLNFAANAEFWIPYRSYLLL